MSALDGWIDVCRAGSWRDSQGRDVAIDEARLDRIVAAHAAADPAPVVVGHPETDAPAFAWIDGLRRSGDRLQATLRDIAAPFREAVEAGRYAGRSIALQGDTLRHLGFLGGRAPAVRGLAPTRFAASPAARLPRWVNRDTPRGLAPRSARRYTKPRMSPLWSTGTTSAVHPLRVRLVCLVTETRKPRSSTRTSLTKR